MKGVSAISGPFTANKETTIWSSKELFKDYWKRGKANPKDPGFTVWMDSSLKVGTSLWEIVGDWAKMSYQTRRGGGKPFGCQLAANFSRRLIQGRLTESNTSEMQFQRGSLTNCYIEGPRK